MQLENESLHKSVLSKFRIKSAQSLTGDVLDCGGGLGEYLPFFTADKVFVFDISFNALAHLQHGLKICGDGCRLPFKDSSFDNSWACAVAQYLPLDGFISELKRVTRPGGRILILVPNGKSPWDWIKKIFNMETWWDQEGIHKQYCVKDLACYGKVYGEIRFLYGEQFLRKLPNLGHTLLLEIRLDGAHDG